MMQPKPWLSKIKRGRWRLTKDKCSVAMMDGGWYKVVIRTPELHLETTRLNTQDYANDFIAMITEGMEKPTLYQRLIYTIFRV